MQQGKKRDMKLKRVFDIVPMTYGQLFPQLLKHSLVEPKLLKPVIPPYDVDYDPNMQCDYHAGALGHSIEDYRAFKEEVQDLLDAKAINFGPASKI